MHIDEVFGIKKELVKSKIDREVDSNFNDLLLHKNDQHIVIYGGSKQGKSYLVKAHEDKIKNSITICMSNRYKTTYEFYRVLLSTIKAKVLINEEASLAGGAEIKVEAGVSAKIAGFLSANKKIEAGGKIEGGKKYEYEYVSNDLSDVNCIYALLKECNQVKDFIILENYHFCSNEFKKLFAEDLRTWLDYNVRFIILGVASEQAEIGLNESNLRDRVTALSVEPWESEELKRVLLQGADFLNIEFDLEVKQNGENILDEFTKASKNSVGILQKIANKTLKNLGITSRQATKRVLTYEQIEPQLSLALSAKAAEYTDMYRFLKEVARISTAKDFFCSFFFVSYLYDNEDFLDDSLKVDLEKPITVKDVVEHIKLCLSEKKYEVALGLVHDEGLEIDKEDEIRLSVTKFFDSINEKSRKLSDDNNIYYDERVLNIVNKYLIFYLQYCDLEDFPGIIPTWKL